ncbi:MAG: hypothetical protein LC662_01250 [Rhodothermaceae bacterium]|nr:hypothetical protein [Rhodothermaceae bacterium]
MQFLRKNRFIVEHIKHQTEILMHRHNGTVLNLIDGGSDNSCRFLAPVL